jgi:retron-type reverse transcriptase
MQSMYLNPTSPDKIAKVLSDLKNTSPGHDDIDIKLVKRIKPYILIPLTHICNLSFSTSKIPSEMKIAKVIPIHKKNAKNEFANYRPVSVLPVFSKMIEKLMFNRLLMFLDKYEILYENQFGFRKNMSTRLALCSLVNEFQGAIERKEIMISIFIDLSRAFDTISHDILFAKLQHYGIRGNTLEWIKNYLTDRKQYAIYNGDKSTLGSLTIGVPQTAFRGVTSH